MCTIVTTKDGHVLGVHDWANGFKALRCPGRKQLSVKELQDDALRHALWLQNHKSCEAGLDFLENFLAVFKDELGRR
jgi:hypothetical protein